MPSILEINRRRNEIAQAARQALADQKAGTITMKAFNTTINGLSDQSDELDQAERAYKSALKWSAAGSPGESGAVPAGMGGQQFPKPEGLRGTASELAPLGFSTVQLKSMHEAAQSRSPFQIRTKAATFNSGDSLLPPELQPSVVGPTYEGRLLDHLPILPTSAPSIEYIRHTSTTGAPAITAEGAAKPELVFVTDSVIVAAQKIACHAAISWESMTDFDAFTSYFTGELQRQVINVENDELLNGAGTTGHLAGLLNTSGILTHATATDTGPDSVELAIAALRTGAALAEANLLVLHPNTWSALRRTKDLQGRYIVAQDPTLGAAKQLWGVEVLPTTKIAAGVGALLDTTKLGFVVVRESLTLRTGTNEDDFTKNLQRWVCEERLGLAVERPSAVCNITGLPVA